MEIANMQLDYAENESVHKNQITALVPVNNTIDKHGVWNKIFQRSAKRTVDILGGLAGIIALIPITIGLFVAKLFSKDKGPLFYSQLRIGKNGKLFKMWKFRSMVVGADEKLEKYLKENPKARKEYRINKKLKDDPRITKLGKFIRKTSLDEFPQFINVFRGEMSLVGPRPYLPREKEDMGSYYACITKCKPGVTGYWQVNGRSEVNFEERLNMDMVYYRERSFKRDIQLLFSTVVKVFKNEGAV